MLLQLQWCSVWGWRYPHLCTFTECCSKFKTVPGSHQWSHGNWWANFFKSHECTFDLWIYYNNLIQHQYMQVVLVTGSPVVCTTSQWKWCVYHFSSSLRWLHISTSKCVPVLRGYLKNCDSWSLKNCEECFVFSYYRAESCKESLKQLGEIAGEADDLRAQALHDCCRFDALLEFGTSL